MRAGKLDGERKRDMTIYALESDRQGKKTKREKGGRREGQKDFERERHSKEEKREKEIGKEREWKRKKEIKGEMTWGREKERERNCMRE
jgi:hypothetical protein